MAETHVINTKAVDMPQSWQGEMKALLTLGLPMALTQLVQFSIFTIDVLMIARLGAEDLAAAALGGVIFFLLWMLGSGPVNAVSPLVSQALGADKMAYEDVRYSVRMSLWVIALMTPLLIIMLLFSEPLAIAFGQDPVIAKKAAHYIWALALSWPFAMSIIALRNFLAAIGKTAVPFMLVSLSIAINAGLNALLIFGLLGFPKLGLVGAGVASTLATIINFCFFVIYIERDKDARNFRIFQGFFEPVWVRFREVIALGWPMSITTIFEGMLFNACVLIMGLIGVVEMAAYQVALNVAALAYMLPWGLAMAGAVRIGLATGSGNIPAQKRASLTTLGAATIIITLIALPMALYPDIIAGLYLKGGNNIEAVQTLVILFLPIGGAFAIFDAFQVAANQLLRGLKDVRWPMALCGISYWAIGFPMAAYLGLKTELGAVGVWYGLMAGLIAASVLLFLRLWWLVWRPGATGSDSPGALLG